MEELKSIRELDKENMELFSKYQNFNGTCVICGHKENKYDAFSKRGKRWTCNRCWYRLQDYLGISSAELLSIIHRED